MMNMSYTILVQLLLLLSLHLTETQCSTRHVKMFEFQRKLQQNTNSIKNNTAPAPPFPNPAKSNGRVFYPIGYGGDPTGAKDSTAAVVAAVNDVVKLQNGAKLLPGISDLGGAVIDLQGGTFLISTPIRFPPDIGNFVVQGGTLRASNKFPGDRHLMELWAPDSQNGAHHGNQKDINNGVTYEDVTFKDLLLDSSLRGGGLLVIDSARVRITNCFFLHFTTQGILVQRGHETFIRTCFLGQHPTVGGDSNEKGYTGTAIDIASNDNAITDVAIFSAAIGIVLRGQANIVTGVHCYNKATYFGGVGILVKSAQNRIIDAYLDYNSIVVEDPNQITISNGFFLGDANIVLKSIAGRMSGVNIVNNMFTGAGDPKKMVPTVKLEGRFRSIDQVAVDHNAVSGMALKSTAAHITLQANGTKWVANFDPLLLFPNKINHIQYSFHLRGRGAAGFPAHAITNVSKNTVVIESHPSVNAVVSVSVDQHNMAGEGSLYV